MKRFKSIAEKINMPAERIKKSDEYYDEMMNEVVIEKYKKYKN